MFHCTKETTIYNIDNIKIKTRVTKSTKWKWKKKNNTQTTQTNSVQNDRQILSDENKPPENQEQKNSQAASTLCPLCIRYVYIIHMSYVSVPLDWFIVEETDIVLNRTILDTFFELLLSILEFRALDSTQFILNRLTQVYIITSILLIRF